MKIVVGFVLAIALAALGFIGFVAYEDHKVVRTVSVLATEIGELNGQHVTATDVVAALVNERIEAIKAQRAAKAVEAPKQ